MKKPLTQIAFDFTEAPKPEANTLLIKAEEEKPDTSIREIPALNKPISITKTTVKKKASRGRMKLSDMAITADLVVVPEDAVLFSKQYYNIGSVAEMFKVNVSLLRYWEKEFDILKPRKNGKGDRLFRPEDIKYLKMIHHLLRQKKFTIDGAKDFIKKNKQAEENYAVIESLQKLKSFLNELKANL
ncbi:MAG TPA: MerR family transcriptional regulator [Ferruginibacter sp.]|nr:MerR family transcriptional regulator [Ferruginibacter sp.]HPA23174.1 MerR family transcriptional regulator [Ferruginibacter sp.]HQV44724.1 MerR family transcriptional regulator [Ferruginibacter sp.]HQW63037.1 MerR family transcriptional regulator [Ferruginibacter sp.]HQY18452.1 MerR family transcriptional regulator [Ferruginibacter sp.]